MRGNVCIELHNHKTGLRDRIEGHNDITDALQRAVNYATFYNSGAIRPVAKTLLGGLHLMDGALSGGDIFVPSGTKIIGSGFQGSNPQSNMVGSYNELESGLDSTQKIYTHVWDFATSEANGTIESVALLPNDGGAYPGAMFPILPNVNAQGDKSILCIDDENGDVYYYVPSYNPTFQPVPVYKSHIDFKNIMLHTTLNYDGTANMIPDGEDTGKTVLDVARYVNGNDGNIYTVIAVPSSSQLKFASYEIDDFSFTRNADITITFSTSNIVGNYAVDSNYIYAVESDGYVRGINRYDRSRGTSTYFDLSADFGTIYNISLIAPGNGDLYCYCNRGGTNVDIRISENGIININEASNNDHPHFGYDNYTSTVLDDGTAVAKGLTPHIPCNWLMTNYNLETPVTKTPLTSMKVIYTLTQD